MTTKIQFMTDDVEAIRRSHDLKHLLIGFMTSYSGQDQSALVRAATTEETNRYERIFSEFTAVAAAVNSEFDIEPPTDVLDMLSISKAILSWLITP